jgi:hypothetical protein
VGVFTRPERLLPPSLRLLGGLLVVLVLGACSHRTDTGMIDAAESLVPSESEILEVNDNSKGLTIEVGDYWVALRISDGGFGPELLRAIEERAGANGWQERYRCDVPAGVTLGYVRDDYKVNLGVRTNKESVDAYIHIQRLGDGNPWPPDC